MNYVENTQEILNAAEASFAKLTIHDKHPHSSQDEMSSTQELKRLKLSHNSRPKQIEMMLQVCKVHINLHWGFFIFKTFTLDFSYMIYSNVKVKPPLESLNFADS